LPVSGIENQIFTTWPNHFADYTTPVPIDKNNSVINYYLFKNILHLKICFLKRAKCQVSDLRDSRIVCRVWGAGGWILPYY
jgi:hypothetical protein